MNNFKIVKALILVCFIFLAGCQGYRSEKPPIHPNPNMDWQPKFKAQSKPLQPVDGTVAWGNEQSFNDSNTRQQYIQNNTQLYEGRNSDGSFIDSIPLTITDALMERGQERYNIYCAVCHTETGNGTNSIISKKGWIAYNLYSELTQSRSDGELFDAITNGIRTMGGYKKQISTEDRWAIVLYVRALQKAANASVKDIPNHLKDNIQ